MTKDGVYIVSGRKTYRATRSCKCTKRTCSLYDAEKCESFDGKRQPCVRLSRVADRCNVRVESCNFQEVRNA